VSRSLHAVLIDMDGTLVDTERLWFVAEGDVVSQLGGVWRPEHQAALVGGNLRRTTRYMLDVTGVDIAEEDVAAQLLDRMAELLSRDVTPLPGAAELLGDLHRAAVPCALVTATHRRLVEPVLDAIGREYFAVSVAGDEVRHSKPAPDPYLTAAALLGVDPAHCVALEDSPTGVASAEAAGCMTVAIPSLLAIAPGPDRVVVASLREVTLSWLDQLAAAWDSRAAS
jgi:HAD superfamily hydrolase (TIGR01509 family)